jgi:hypothetical protein
LTYSTLVNELAIFKLKYKRNALLVFFSVHSKAKILKDFGRDAFRDAMQEAGFCKSWAYEAVKGI